MAQSLQKRTRRRFVFLSFAALVIVVFLYIGFIYEPNPVDQYAPEPERLPELRQSVLDSEELQNFNVWSVLPVQIGPTGKENPFSQ